MTKIQFRISLVVIFVLFIAGIWKVNYETQREAQKRAYVENFKAVPSNYIPEQENVSEAILEPISEWLEVEATAYCPCIKCCGKTDAITASGIKAVESITIAADWNIFPCGAIIDIEDFGMRIVQDKGGAIKGNKIDIYFEIHEKALEFGRKNMKARIIK